MIWRELRPFHADEEDGFLNVLKRVPRFVFVLSRDDKGTVRIHIGFKGEEEAAINSLEGMEVLAAEPFDFAGYATYRRYRHREHCAEPIIEDEEPASIVYRVLDREINGEAFLCVNARSTQSMQAVYSYIRMHERGESPGIGGVFSIFSTPPKTVSPRRQNKIQAAKSKINRKTLLFECEIITGAASPADADALQSIFPARAFVHSKTKEKKAVELALRPPSRPLFLGHRNVLLNDAEMLSFVGFPRKDDLRQTNLARGKTTSYTTGPRLDGFDDTV